LDVYTTPSEIVLSANVPGLKPEDVEVTLEGDGRTFANAISLANIATYTGTATISNTAKIDTGTTQVQEGDPLIFLNQVNSGKSVQVGKKVVVIGGGNVAMDSARCALRLGGEVTVVYRRTEELMPARRDEVVNAKEEGINFVFLANPTKFQFGGINFSTGRAFYHFHLFTPIRTIHTK
jgi:glutamate dehydrogenase/leucine dehydrogenase